MPLVVVVKLAEELEQPLEEVQQQERDLVKYAFMASFRNLCECETLAESKPKKS